MCFILCVAGFCMLCVFEYLIELRNWVHGGENTAEGHTDDIRICPVFVYTQQLEYSLATLFISVFACPPECAERIKTIECNARSKCRAERKKQSNSNNNNKTTTE